MNKAISIGQGFSATFSKINEETTIFRTILIGLGVVFSGLAVKALVAFAPFYALVAIIAGIALIIDDIWTAFSGGESIAKRVFDHIVSSFRSLKSWVLQQMSQIWDFLPGSLQRNLKEAWAFVQSFVLGYINIVITVMRRYWGFVSEVFSAIYTKLKAVTANVFQFLKDTFNKIGAYIAQRLVASFAQAVRDIKEAILSLKSAISDAVPDFVKKGFSTAIDFVGGIGSKYDKKPSQHHLAPNIPAPNQIQNSNNQSVSVSVNVKSGASAHEIGGEVSKAVRRELEKERINAFMGVF